MASKMALSRSFRLWGRALVVQRRSMGTGPLGYFPSRLDIGKREVVGFGLTGEECYVEDVHSPFPAIRFKEDTAEIAMLREKEKGDWKKLTVPERKELYRASFAQTLTEMEAPTGEWKPILGVTLFLSSLGIWFYLWMRKFVYDDLPETMTNEELVKDQIRFMIEGRTNPVQGLASNYDYEKGQWKK